MTQKAEEYFKDNFEYIKKLQKEVMGKTFEEVKKYISKKTGLTPSFLMLSCDSLEEYNKLIGD